MKKIIYILILISAALLTSCLKDEENIFDDSAANRVQATLDEVHSLLREAENGWMMEYYPSKDREYGGFNVLMSFPSYDSVVIASEIANANLTASSMYELIADAGPVLTFNTYNDILHYFSDPEITDVGERGEGMNGDYEFIIQESSAQQIVFKGRKTHNIIVMSPMPSDVTWEQYLLKIKEMNEYLSEVPDYELVAGDKTITTTVNSYGTVFHFSIVEGQTAIELDAPFLVTPQGIKFYEEIEIAGKKMHEFTLSEDKTGLICTTDPTVIIRFVYPPINEIFATTTTQWIFDNSSFNATMQAAWDAAASSVLAAEGEVLQMMYWGYSHATTKTSCIALGTNAYWAILGATFTPVAGTEDQLAVAFTSQDVLNWSFYDSYYRPFLDLLEQNSPYKLAGDSKSPSKITFTSTKNPDVTFVVEK